MKKVHFVMMALLLCVSMMFPRAAVAQEEVQDQSVPKASRFALPTPVPIDGNWSLQKQSSPGGRLLRNTMIGAGVGAGLVGLLVIRGAGDCGNCDSDYAKAILGGAMYGALVGAAIRISPSRQPSPGRPQRHTTVSPHVSKHTKSVKVAVRF